MRSDQAEVASIRDESPPPATGSDRLAADGDPLEEALERLEAEVGNGFLSADAVIIPLADMWEQARATRPDAAAVIERFLRRLTHRDVVTRSDLETVVRRVRSCSTERDQ